MTRYVKGSLFYTCTVAVVTVLILLFRSEWFGERKEWASAVARGTSRAYREYYSKWRMSDRAQEALSAWGNASRREFDVLNWTSAYAVETFIKDHPEFQEVDIRKAQYEAVIKDGSYETLRQYLEGQPQADSRRDEIEKRIDSVVMAEVKPALRNDDFQKLQLLSKKYSDWRGCQEWIEGRIALARDNSAKAEWARLAYSKSEWELRRFMNKYSGTTYATEAAKRIDALYDDFDYVKSKGTLKAYLDFADTHPNSPRVNEAWRCVADELESYVFKRKALGTNESLVRSTLARYEKERPWSGSLYGTGGYYTSPLKITTPAYGGDDYFVKLVNITTGGEVGIYVRAGTTTKVEVPDGTYSVRYATGTRWYGTRFLFGLNARYSRASQDFTFSNGSGYMLTLQKVAHGNLHTSPMSANEF